MQTVTRPHLTEEEYIIRERASSERHEYLRGEVFAMSGGSPAHALISANVTSVLRNALRNRCRVFSSDLKIHIPTTGLYTYADALVICGSVELHPKFPDVVLNPCVIVEVLSPTTEKYDRTEKLSHYKAIASLSEYVLIAQDEHAVDHFLRGAPRWGHDRFTAQEGSVPLPTLGIDLPFHEIYLGVEGIPASLTHGSP